MDQIKIGKFIATLRRQSGLTQEKLGEKIGVTNKQYLAGKMVTICQTLKCSNYLQRNLMLA